MTEGPRQQVFRSSCNGVSVRLRVNADDESWIVIKAPGTEPRYREIPETKVDAVVAEFQAIGDSTERFAAFVNAYSTQ